MEGVREIKNKAIFDDRTCNFESETGVHLFFTCGVQVRNFTGSTATSPVVGTVTSITNGCLVAEILCCKSESYIHGGNRGLRKEHTMHAGIWATREPTSYEETFMRNKKKSRKVHVMAEKRKEVFTIQARGTRVRSGGRE